MALILHPIATRVSFCYRRKAALEWLLRKEEGGRREEEEGRDDR